MPFTASVDPSLPWKFRPKQRTVRLPIGEQGEVAYEAENCSRTQTTLGTATFNVTPLQAGRYFSKIQCFCFEASNSTPASLSTCRCCFTSIRRSAMTRI